MLAVAGSTLFIYLFLVAGFALVGRRTLSQLSMIDLVIILIMGSAVETAMVHGDTSLTAGLASATTLLVINRVFAVGRRRGWLRWLFPHEPYLLVQDGRVIEAHLKRAELTRDDLLEAMRERGYSSFADVRYAVLEEDGEINVIPVQKEPGR
jgi:uncharacterized membrane protein YcaP (DUF421 family)